MKLSERGRLFVTVLCTIEQFFYLIGTVWLVGWKGWSPAWFVFTFLLLSASAPSICIRGIEWAGSTKE